MYAYREHFKWNKQLSRNERNTPSCVTAAHRETRDICVIRVFYD